MGKSGGGNSADHRKAKRLERAIEKVLAERPLKSPQPVTPQRVERPKSENIRTYPVTRQHRGKFETFWASTPVWGVLGLLGGAVFSLVSLKVVAFLSWAVLCFEFFRVKVFENSRLHRYTANLFFTVTLGLAFIFTWPLVPKPKQQPTLDQEMTEFSKRFPGLSSSPTSVRPLTQNITNVLPPKSNPPDFRLNIINVVHEDLNDSMKVYILFNAVNLGSPSNISKMVIDLDTNGRTYEASYPLHPKRDATFPLFNGQGLSGSTYWNYVLSDYVPSTNVVAPAWIEGIFYGVSRDDVVKSQGILTLRAIDARGKESSAKFQFTGNYLENKQFQVDGLTTPQ